MSQFPNNSQNSSEEQEIPVVGIIEEKSKPIISSDRDSEIYKILRDKHRNLVRVGAVSCTQTFKQSLQMMLRSNSLKEDEKLVALELAQRTNEEL